MRHPEEERDLGRLGGERSENAQLLDGEQSQPRAGMAWAGRAWRTGQEPLAQLHGEHGWPQSPLSKGTQQSLRGSEEEEQQQGTTAAGRLHSSEVTLEPLHGQHSWQKEGHSVVTQGAPNERQKFQSSEYRPSTKGVIRMC